MRFTRQVCGVTCPTCDPELVVTGGGGVLAVRGRRQIVVYCTASRPIKHGDTCGLVAWAAYCVGGEVGVVVLLLSFIMVVLVVVSVPINFPCD